MKRLVVLIFAMLPLMVFSQSSAPYKFNTTKVDVGKVKVFEVAKAEFVMKNTGSQPVIITSAQGSCGCVKVFYPHKPVKPGESVKITVTFRPYAEGKFRKAAFLQFSLNPPYNHATLTMKGTAVR